MAEAAYRTTVLSAGMKQKSLTTGWEVLGLNKETATRIWEAEKEEGFMSERQRMYGGQSTKYDKKGNIIDKEGKVLEKADPNAPDDEEEEDDAPASNVYECGECGFTLFIAKGREFKFYGDDFACPECGAAKDKFNARDIDAE
jgi:rubredoxin